jgi:site-specific DNA recombinase
MKRLHGAFICARYSTDNQNPDSIEVQVSKCTTWCNQNELPILGVFADEAVSGMKDTRPEYARMMEQLRLGLADTVVIYDQSRMFRKMEAWFSFRSELSSMGVTVISVTQPAIGKDLRDPMNFVTEGSMALFNQMHSLITRQKVIEKMRFMARNGQHTGGMAPLGYQIVDGRLEICEEEAVVVRRIFTEYASGRSYRQIIEGLNRDGLKTRRGNSFGTNSLHDLLKNEKYIGVMVYGAMSYREDGTRNTHAKDGPDVIRIEDALPPIIDKALFLEVQHKMSLNKKQQGGRPATRRDYPLKGKVFCGYCKSAMNVSISQEKYFYYKCDRKKRTHICENKPISVDTLERTVADVVRQFLGNRDFVDELIAVLNKQREVICSGAVQSLQNLISRRAELRQKLDNGAAAILSGLNSPTVVSMMADLEAQISLIDVQIANLKRSVDAAAIPESRIREILDYCLKTETTDISALLAVVTRVEVYEDRIEVWTILDTDPDGNLYDTDTGVTITPCSGSGVPTVIVTMFYIRMIVTKKNTS